MTKKELMSRIRIIYGGYMLMEGAEKLAAKADFERMSFNLFRKSGMDIYQWQEIKREALG